MIMAHLQSHKVAVASVHAYHSRWFVARRSGVEELLVCEEVYLLTQTCMVLGMAAPHWKVCPPDELA